MSALPLPSPQLPRNKTACIIHSCYSGTPNRLFIRSFLTEEKVKKDQQCKVSCSAYECSSRQHSNTFFLAILGMAEGSGQWNAFARVLLNIKPVTSLELFRQSECKKKKKKKAICLLKILTLQSACPQKIGNRVEIES